MARIEKLITERSTITLPAGSTHLTEIDSGLIQARPGAIPPDLSFAFTK